jgi:glutathione S-transferase
MSADRQLTITSHALCPTLHAWHLALLLSDREEGRDFTVVRLRYPDRPSWPLAIPTGASLPFMVTERGTVLTGPMPVLHYIAETGSTPACVPADAEARVLMRNRAMLGNTVITALRPILVAPSDDAVEDALTKFFAEVASVERASWGELPQLDAVMLAAAATIAMSQPRLMTDARWNALPQTRRHLEELSADARVRATRAEPFGAHFVEFFAAFGGVLGDVAQAG